jgi:hypothetical protein
LLAQLSYSYIEKPIKENNKISNRYLYALILVNLSFVASLMIQNTLSDWKELDAKEEEKKSKTTSSNFNPSDLNQSILNIILDKISSKGIGSLSDKEKDFLSKYSD